jgi:hypothetical protein
MTALAPTIDRRRKMRSGTSGACWRDSISTKAASKTAEPARSKIVCVDPQPAVGASTSA